MGVRSPLTISTTCDRPLPFPKSDRSLHFHQERSPFSTSTTLRSPFTHSTKSDRPSHIHQLRSTRSTPTICDRPLQSTKRDRPSLHPSTCDRPHHIHERRSPSHIHELQSPLLHPPTSDRPDHIHQRRSPPKCDHPPSSSPLQAINELSVVVGCLVWI